MKIIDVERILVYQRILHGYEIWWWSMVCKLSPVGFSRFHLWEFCRFSNWWPIKETNPTCHKLRKRPMSETMPWQSCSRLQLHMSNRSFFPILGTLCHLPKHYFSSWKHQTPYLITINCGLPDTPWKGLHWVDSGKCNREMESHCNPTQVFSGNFVVSRPDVLVVIRGL